MRTTWLAVVLLVVSTPVMAQAPASAGDTMHRYFSEELREGVVFGAMGLASIGSGVGLLAAGGALGQGGSIPLLAVGVLQVLLGLGLWIRTPGQVRALDAQLATSPEAFAMAERTRMRAVNARFPLYTVVEASLFFVGVGLAGVGGALGSDFALGAGLTLALEATAMLILDHFAGQRGAAYESALLGFRF